MASLLGNAASPKTGSHFSGGIDRSCGNRSDDIGQSGETWLVPVPDGLTTRQKADFIVTIRRYATRSRVSPWRIIKGGRHRRFLMWRRAAQCDLIDMGHSFRAVAKMFSTDDGTIKNNVERERRLRAAGRSPASPPAGQLPAAGPSSPAAGTLSGGVQ